MKNIKQIGIFVVSLTALGIFLGQVVWGENGWNNFWNVFGNIFGSAIGVFGAYWVANWQMKKDKHRSITFRTMERISQSIAEIEDVDSQSKEAKRCDVLFMDIISYYRNNEEIRNQAIQGRNALKQKQHDQAAGSLVTLHKEILKTIE